MSLDERLKEIKLSILFGEVSHRLTDKDIAQIKAVFADAGYLPVNSGISKEARDAMQSQPVMTGAEFYARFEKELEEHGLVNANGMYEPFSIYECAKRAAGLDK